MIKATLTEDEKVKMWAVEEAIEAINGGKVTTPSIIEAAQALYDFVATKTTV